MKKSLNEKEWLKEFDEFISAEKIEAPTDISNKILTNTKNAMNPSSLLVFLKLLGIHSVFGTLSLAICNQFGLNPFNTQLSLSDYFMTFGHSFCMLLCGVIFVSSSIVGAWVILNRDEFSVLKKNYLIQVCSLSFLSLATFMALGAHVTLSLALLWFVGALVGGAIPTWTLVHKTIRFT
jgi:hypothetical protein